MTALSEQPQPGTDAPPPPPDTAAVAAVARPPAPPRRLLAVRVARAAAAGVGVAGLLVAGRTSGALLGGAGLLVTVLLVLMVPTSRDLSRRILLAGCLVLGWTPLLWWVPIGAGTPGRVTAELALLGGGLAAWVAAGPRPRARAALLLPRPRVVDLYVPVGVGVAILVLAPWLRAKSPEQTLGSLMTGWDNSAHFAMVHSIRRFGTTMDLLGPPATGTRWQFDSYPQGFHTVLATIVEIIDGPGTGPIGDELARYSTSVALFVIAVVALLIGGFCSLPVLRGRPALAAPVAAFAAGVVLFGPGAHAVQGGIGNFTQACVLVVAIALIGVAVPRVVAPVPLAALGGAVAGVAQSWVLLLVLAAPALFVVLLPARRSRWRASRGRVVAAVLVTAAVLAVLARTAVVLMRVEAESPLTLTGGGVPLDVGQLLAALLGTAGACLLLHRARPGAEAGRSRVVALVGVPVLGLATAVALAVLQITVNGEISYYGYKFMIGLEIVLLLLLAVPVVHLVAGRRPRPMGAARRVRGGLGAAAMALAVTQVFGLTVPDLSEIGLAPGAEGLRGRAAQFAVIEEPASAADLVERAGRADPPAGSRAYFLDLPSDGRVDPILAAQWYFALTDTWTTGANSVVSGIVLSPGPLEVEYAAASVRRILDEDPRAVVLVRRAYLRRLVEQLAEPALTPRILPL